MKSNYQILAEIVEKDEAIRNISIHRKADGTMDVEGNLKLWNSLVERFDCIKLWDKTPNYDDRDPNQIEPNIIFIKAQNTDERKGTVIVSCGGGFETRTGCEGFNIAKYFADAGFNCAILTYRLRPYSRQDALDDITRAVKVLRYRADELNITDKICCMGFSAGGMLSANLATHFDTGKESDDPVEKMSSRPDAIVLGYGAFCFIGLHQGFFIDPFAQQIRNPFFKDVDELRYFSPEINISKDTPPFFIWQTNSDDPRNAFCFGEALTANRIPFEMHLYPDGVHGIALADGHNDLNITAKQTQSWAKLCAGWMTNQGL